MVPRLVCRGRREMLDLRLTPHARNTAEQCNPTQHTQSVMRNKRYSLDQVVALMYYY